MFCWGLIVVFADHAGNGALFFWQFTDGGLLSTLGYEYIIIVDQIS
jgi:hypothetical protein